MSKKTRPIEPIPSGGNTINPDRISPREKPNKKDFDKQLEREIQKRLKQKKKANP